MSKVIVKEKELAVVGHPVNRIDALAKVTGTAKYAADYYFPNMLYAAVRHADIPHGYIKSIDTSEAEKVEGVVKIVTGKDVPGGKVGYPIPDEEIIVKEKVRYVGDVVAVVAAETLEAAREAARKIKVEYEPLPVVLDPEEAMKEDAPKIHEQGNVITHYKIRKGDIEKGFSEADHVIEREFRTQFIEHSYLEPMAVVAVPIGDIIEIYGTIQNPHNARRVISISLAMPMHKIRVIQPALGGSFGGKDDTANIIAARAALLAKLTGRPVKIEYTREEDMKESYKRHPYIMRYKVGFTKDGKITAMEIKVISNAGAYSSSSPLVLYRSTVQCTGAYEVPNIKGDFYTVYTNAPFTGAMRGFGAPQINFAVESLMDEIAEFLGMDPVELRLKNAYREGSKTPTGQVLKGHTVSIREIIQKLSEIAEWKKKREEYSKDKGDIRRGIGISCAFRGVSLGAEGADYAGAIVEVFEDGHVTVTSGISEMGQGSKTVMSQTAAEVLGIPIDYVTFVGPDTSVSPDSGPTVASRGTIMGCGAVKNAAEIVKERMAKFAAKLLETSFQDIVFENGYVFSKSDPKKKITFKELAKKCWLNRVNLSAIGWFLAPTIHWDPETGEGEPYFTYTYYADIAEVEVNMKTGIVKVKKVYAMHDPGRVINPKTARGQIYGGVAMGIGYALKEEFKLDEKGYPITLNFDKYQIIRANEMPDVEVYFLEHPDPNGPFGAKSLGEPSYDTVAPSVINAIAHATGIRVRELPATRDKILKLLKEKEGSN
ncbi:MAG: xanthine dehydrogenase family protein molybdopterin-binding subunit [Candidatus Asgardarchaeia archaeon]